ncbi:Tryptophan aminotransferase-related 3 -like protein [Gossypium arboreum]|uniref:Tryptophan aminotransferase-related 3-like protein n=1 Tax=Gossypium arboreum TaxID=29729 RepID=A0A0B0NHK6_GOSAR|nr:Tryptophan aminotransferase-related 3 -like protein [Gossypium arboreum]
MEQIRNDKSYLHVSAMEQILATDLISLSHRPYLFEVAREQVEDMSLNPLSSRIRNDESYLHVLAREQTLAIDLISLRADRKWRVLSPCIGCGADFSHWPYFSDVAREQVEDTSLNPLSHRVTG